MLFQSLDYKKWCRSIYCNGKIYERFDPSLMTDTWEPSVHFQDYDVNYASLYCGGLSIDEVCPDHLVGQWRHLRNRKKAFIKSLVTSKVDMDDVCIYQMLPHRFLKEYCEVKNSITKHALDTYQTPNNYCFLQDLTKVLLDIGSKPVYINNKLARLINSNTKDNILANLANERNQYCLYNIFGTKTGRLTTKKGSFPILNIKKEYRSIIMPDNKYFLELDYNAAELRVMYALQRTSEGHNINQPQEDMHQWNIKNIFDSEISRDEAKKSIFAWLYNPISQNSVAEKFYNRSIALEQSKWDGNSITNYFGRRIAVDERRALNYLLQSTLSDLFLRKKIKIFNMLKGRASRIAFSVHDSLVIDMSLEDTDLVKAMVEEFSDTPFGRFKVNVNVGSDYGNLREARGL